MDLDDLEKLLRAYVDAHAAMLADGRSAQAWVDDNNASKALAAHYGGEYTSPSMCADMLALITRLRAADHASTQVPSRGARARDGCVQPTGSPSPLHRRRPVTDDLRTLAQAVVDAWSALAGTDGIEYLCAQQTFDDASDALEEALECGHLADADSTARAILAALDAANAQGYARAIGEVESAMDAASDEALAEYQARRSDYRDGFCDGLCEAYRIAQNTAKAARERAAAAQRD